MSTKLNIDIVSDHFLLHIHHAQACQHFKTRNISKRISFLLCFSFPLCHLTDYLLSSFLLLSFSCCCWSFWCSSTLFCGRGTTFLKDGHVHGLQQNRCSELGAARVCRALLEQLVLCVAEATRSGIPGSKREKSRWGERNRKVVAPEFSLRVILCVHKVLAGCLAGPSGELPLC